MRQAAARDIAPPLAAFALVVGLWMALDALFGIREVIVPNPWEILQSIASNFSLVLTHTGITMLESVLGFLSGSMLGILIAILFTYSPLARKALYPYMIGIKATPVYALAPLLVLWFGNGIWSKVVVAALVAFFPVLVSMVKGLTSIERNHHDLFRSLGANKWQEFSKLRLPSSLPHLFPSLKVATTFSVVGATIGEFAGSSAGVGHLIVNASYYLDTSLMFAGIVAISVGGYLFFIAMEMIEKRVVSWQD